MIKDAIRKGFYLFTSIYHILGQTTLEKTKEQLQSLLLVQVAIGSGWTKHPKSTRPRAKARARA